MFRFAVMMLVLAATAQAAVVAQVGDLYGRWSTDERCPWFEIFTPTEVIYIGKERSSPLIRKGSLSLDGDTLSKKEVGNQGEMDTITKYKVVDSNSLKVVSVEDLPGKTGTKSFPGIVGKVFKRCR